MVMRPGPWIYAPHLESASILRPRPHIDSNNLHKDVRSALLEQCRPLTLDLIFSGGERRDFVA